MKKVLEGQDMCAGIILTIQMFYYDDTKPKKLIGVFWDWDERDDRLSITNGGKMLKFNFVYGSFEKIDLYGDTSKSKVFICIGTLKEVNHEPPLPPDIQMICFVNTEREALQYLAEHPVTKRFFNDKFSQHHYSEYFELKVNPSKIIDLFFDFMDGNFLDVTRHKTYIIWMLLNAKTQLL